MSFSPAQIARARNGRPATQPRSNTALAARSLVGAARARPADVALPAVLAPERALARDHVVDVLDRCAALAGTLGPTAFVRGLIESLGSLKADLGPEAWAEVAVPAARDHALAGLIFDCPLTHHSYTRPRGYPGDAGLLDLIYRHDDAAPVLAASTGVGRAVFDFTITVAACEAVRRRRETLARTIDAVAAARPGAEMLAIACGHLREAELSAALAAGEVGRFVATDQDAGSLEVVEDYAGSVSSAIETRALSVRDFIAGRHGLGSFDLVYAAGLYDYLDDRVAARLTRKLFGLLKPGGRLLVANFLTGIWEVPYMEAYMDWHLLYRSQTQIRAFAGEISDLDIARTTYFEDDTGCIGYLELERA